MIFHVIILHISIFLGLPLLIIISGLVWDLYGHKHTQIPTLLCHSVLICRLQNLFVADGGKIVDGTAVESIEPGKITTVRTKDESYRTQHLILTPGPWAKELLAKLDIHLPIKVTIYQYNNIDIKINSY